MPDTERLHLVIAGRVQGVFFRDSVRRAALGQGVNGWVSNRADGTVEAVLEGAPDGVGRVAAFCRRGPSRARVDRVEVIREPVEGVDGFEVR